MRISIFNFSLLLAFFILGNSQNSIINRYINSLLSIESKVMDFLYIQQKNFCKIFLENETFNQEMRTKYLEKKFQFGTKLFSFFVHRTEGGVSKNIRN